MKTAKKVALAVVVLLFALAWFAAFTPKARAASDEFHWKHFGANPYAATRTEAMRTRESAFRKLGLPASVIAELLHMTEKAGEKARLTNDRRLTAMISKGSVVHRNVVVAFSTPPISGKMEYAAPAEQWQVSWGGRVYTIFLPEICYNWSSDVSATPKFASPLGRAPDACVTVEYTVKPGDEVRFAVFSRKRLQASACWEFCDGDACSAPPSPCDYCDWIGPQPVLPTDVQPQHTGRYVAQSAKQTLRFPREVMGAYIALCVEREGAQSDSWVVQPNAWGLKTLVKIPYGGQEWPVWGQVDWSKWRNG